jgi:hypothetical protein
MYKPRIVEFKDKFESLKVNTRIRTSRFIPGNLVLIDERKYIPENNPCLVLGTLAGDRNCLIVMSSDSKLFRFSLDDNLKLIKRHATPKLIKQMKQV